MSKVFCLTQRLSEQRSDDPALIQPVLRQFGELLEALGGAKLPPELDACASATSFSEAGLATAQWAWRANEFIVEKIHNVVIRADADLEKLLASKMSADFDPECLLALKMLVDFDPECLRLRLPFEVEGGRGEFIFKINRFFEEMAFELYGDEPALRACAVLKANWLPTRKNGRPNGEDVPIPLLKALEKCEPISHVWDDR